MNAKHNKRISPKDWTIVGLGTVGGFFLVYLPTASLLTGILAGAPSGAAGICAALLLCRKFKGRTKQSNEP